MSAQPHVVHVWRRIYEHVTSSAHLSVNKNMFLETHVITLYCCVPQIQKMGLQPTDISMFSTLMDLVKEARELAEQNQ